MVKNFCTICLEFLSSTQTYPKSFPTFHNDFKRQFFGLKLKKLDQSRVEISCSDFPGI